MLKVNGKSSDLYQVTNFGLDPKDPDQMDMKLHLHTAVAGKCVHTQMFLRPVLMSLDCSLNSADLPVTIPHSVAQFDAQMYPDMPLPNADSWNQSVILSDKNMDIALRDINSAEFARLFEEFGADVKEFVPYVDDFQQNAMDCSPQASISDRLSNVYISGLTAKSKAVR